MAKGYVEGYGGWVGETVNMFECQCDHVKKQRKDLFQIQEAVF
jgi:hypothetical protein